MALQFAYAILLLMSRTKRNLLVAAFLISPVVLGLLLSIAQPPDDGLLNYMAFLAIIFGIPFIAVTGTFISYLSCKSKKADKYLVLGFGLPTLLVCLWELELVQPIYRILFSI